jgi:hypothetical protein
MFSATDLINPFLAAVEPILKKSWGEVKDYADAEAAKMAKTLETIATLRASNKIDDDQAKALLDMQKHAMQSVLLAVEGIGLIAAQNAINAGLAAVKDVVNKALPFPLL